MECDGEGIVNPLVKIARLKTWLWNERLLWSCSVDALLSHRNVGSQGSDEGFSYESVDTGIGSGVKLEKVRSRVRWN